ncbi:MAG: GNAT family N-acetyltransferase [Lachnospiraceae bacterium]|nr:GNAT family N-acetyltransferase [Lachnospiraceae bacterium]
MKLISDYMRDDTKRHMLNGLTQKTFGFDFEGWVTNGYFEGDYIPYSYEEGGKIVSNVSANRMSFKQNGAVKNYIQIGTVMTDPDYRKQGLAAGLMKQVIKEYEKDCDGFYLFGDLSAAGFYRKMDFEIINQYRYFLKEEFCTADKNAEPFRPIQDMDEGVKKKYLEYVRESEPHSSFEQINKYGLQMFYTAGLDNVLYCAELDCFIVLEEEETPILQSVLSGKKVALTDVVRRINLDKPCLMLGFTPLEEDRDKCISEVYDGADDYRLFYRGENLKAIEQDKLYFPDLSHA